MAAEQGIRNMSEENIFDKLMEQYGQAAGESISAMLNTKIEIKEPVTSEILIKDVEYSILEPALFAKSCLTSNAAGTVVMIFRQRDMQAFLNKLMGSDDLPDPDFAFDEVAMSAAGELMNQWCTALPSRWQDIWKIPWIPRIASFSCLTADSVSGKSWERMRRQKLR